MGVIALLHRPFAGWRQCQVRRFHPLAGERTLQLSRTLPCEPDWRLEGLQPTEQDQLDEYAVPEGDEDWPILVELCGQVYLAQGHAGAHRWIDMLPQPYQSEMWRELEGVDEPNMLYRLKNYNELV